MRAGVVAFALLFVSPVFASADEIELVTGETLRGPIVHRGSDEVVLEHPVLGTLTVPRGSIVRIDPPDDDAEVSEEADVPAETDQADGAVETKGEDSSPAEEAPVASPSEPPAAEWSSQLEFGLNLSEGNTQDLRLRTSFRTARESDVNLFRYDATYRFGLNRGQRNENHFTTGAFSEWPFPESRFSVFAQGRYDFSEFQSWDHRVTAGAGLGYTLFDVQRVDEEQNKRDFFWMKLRAGAGLRKEFGSPHEDFEPEGIFGTEARWHINSKQRLDASSTYFPTLDDLNDFRVVSAVDWTIDIDQANGMRLRLGAQHEYESRTSANVRPHDFTAYATLVIDF